MSTKPYEVLYTLQVAVFVADAESEEQAFEQAEEAIFGHPGAIVDAKASELKTESEIDSARRHADEEC